jgi:hypothetical protein
MITSLSLYFVEVNYIFTHDTVGITMVTSTSVITISFCAEFLCMLYNIININKNIYPDHPCTDFSSSEIQQSQIVKTVKCFCDNLKL